MLADAVTVVCSNLQYQIVFRKGFDGSCSWHLVEARR